MLKNVNIKLLKECIEKIYSDKQMVEDAGVIMGFDRDEILLECAIDEYNDRYENHPHQ
tara:strand:- start:10433 stop:10606 length:174 start_codon:yes stop_codon:yes gene_type:complete